MKNNIINSVVMLMMTKLDSTKAEPSLTTCSYENSLCDFDYKTGLRKQCIKRYVLDVSNPNDANYKSA